MGNWLSTSAPTSDALVRSKSSYAYMKDLDSSVEKIKLELEEIKNHFQDWAKHTEVIVLHETWRHSCSFTSDFFDIIYSRSY